MKKKLALLLALSLTVSSLLTGCGGSEGVEQPAAEGKHENVDVELLAASSTVQNVGIAIADVITKNSGFIRMAATGTNSSEANIVQMLEKDEHTNTFYMTSAAPYISAKTGIGAFKDYEPCQDQRLVAAMLYGVNGFVTTDPSIKSLSDLDGKKVAMFADELPQQMAKAAFDILGINVEIKTLTFSDQFTALSDGLVDACLYLGTGLPNGEPLVPASPLQELIANKGGKVYAVTFPADLQAEAVTKAGLDGKWAYSPIICPAGSLQETDTESFEAYGSVTALVACWADTDEEVVYEFTKTLCEKYADLGNYMTELKPITPSLMLSMLYMAEGEEDIHPGALRYYKEAGLWPSVWEEANSK
ncbi:TAXI family TRAP transporter solute-binding subunit [Anaerotruncus sp. DFI.9.16]|uniref:TAXI family TRAP transporter solute-binding subunit n=1 Tax=Anaerotruncus sp. DFI.9.16 TaxID=2965275 RepID=UPI002108682F|nr:TAXI family TRAP transporter solute-binding subunit [Anaerotruncus sp. DFI.9.16]MCQ4896274.1 TAXI family TRAP transporter solute-binding subunit [Anaerotruncus sp. DFI.9.16]